jgi:hypothetical protein
MPDAAARRSRVIRVTSWSIQTLHLESERECCLHLGICLGWHFPMFFLRTTKLFVYIVVRLLDRIQPRSPHALASSVTSVSLSRPLSLQVRQLRPRRRHHRWKVRIR